MKARISHDFISLALIALDAALTPIIANLIPKKPIPEIALFLIGDAALGLYLLIIFSLMKTCCFSLLLCHFWCKDSGIML